jgi:phosphoglycerate dehydrogenase-like enzyme
MPMTVNVRRAWAPVLASVSVALCAVPPVAADTAGQESAAVAALIQRLGLEESATPARDSPGWRKPQRVLVWNVAPQAIPALQAAAPGVKLLLAADAGEAVALAKDADAVLGFCTADVLAAGPGIRWVQSFSAGVERCVSIPVLRERGILLTNMQRVAGPVMAEHVVAMMLAYARGLHFYIPERMAGRWTSDLPAPGRMVTLEGKTVLVVGLGGIGVEVAKRAHALGMRVLATRASGREGPAFVSYVGLPDELVRLAAEADFVVNTVPLTPATTRLFDGRFFAAVKPGAFFVNVGRGQSVVQDELIDALRDGRLGGAGLDVTDPEPLAPDSPLWKMQNVILTPHVSARSDVDDSVRMAVAVENLRRYVAGEKLLSVVDVAKGY